MDLYSELELKEKYQKLYSKKKNLTYRKVDAVKVKRGKEMVVNGDRYLTNFYDFKALDLPSVSEHLPFAYYDLISDVFPQAKNCRFDKVINSDPKIGELPILLKGNIGSGKSQMLNRLIQIKVAKGYKAWTIGDSFNEDRNHYKYGYLDSAKNFIPFQVTYYLPEGVEFAENVTPIWTQRKNVHLVHYSNFNQLAEMILKSNNTFNVIYGDCYNISAKLKIFILVYEYLRRHNLDYEAGDRVLFYHHELSQIFPQTLSKGNHNLLELAAHRFVEMRKFGMQFIGALQLSQELYYRLNYKFPITQNFAQKLSEGASRAEKHARHYTQGWSNFERNGFYMTHQFPPLVEIKNLRLFTKELNVKVEDYFSDADYTILELEEEKLHSLKYLRNLYILRFKSEIDDRLDEIAKFFSLSKRMIHNILKENQLKPKEVLAELNRLNKSRR